MRELIADAVSAQDIGRRPRQEDAVIAQFPQGSGPGLAVLSDGMGGHADGDLASRILVSEMFGELFLSATRDASFSKNASGILLDALDSANERLNYHIKAGCISSDTGGTLMSVAIAGGCLRWLSVGDSPLYLYRGNTLRRLNENHSMSVQLDLMVSNGQMDAETALSHPHRHCLTSAVTGNSIPRVDCPDRAVRLAADDIVVAASDGLNVLTPSRLCNLIRQHRQKDSTDVARELLRAVKRMNAPDQDNVSLVVIKMAQAEQAGLLFRAGQRIGATLTRQGARLAQAAFQGLRGGAGRVRS